MRHAGITRKEFCTLDDHGGNLAIKLRNIRWPNLFYLCKMSTPIIPYQDSTDSKKEQVANMFNRIAGKYDFLNHFLSLGIDKLWRKNAVNELRALKPKRILDIATGTGDLAIDALALNPEQIIGADISENMLEIARQKIARKGLSSVLSVQKGDSENLSFKEGEFDAVMVAFGVRNFENLEKGLSEMFRVLRSGGKTVILEFSRPSAFPFKQVYEFYFRNILPVLGRNVSQDKEAYAYLHRSVSGFPDGADFIQLLEGAGFRNTKFRPLSLGICTIYTGFKLDKEHSSSSIHEI